MAKVVDDVTDALVTSTGCVEWVVSPDVEVVMAVVGDVEADWLDTVLNVTATGEELSLQLTPTRTTAATSAHSFIGRMTTEDRSSPDLPEPP